MCSPGIVRLRCTCAVGWASHGKHPVQDPSHRHRRADACPGCRAHDGRVCGIGRGVRIRRSPHPVTIGDCKTHCVSRSGSDRITSYTPTTVAGTPTPRVPATVEIDDPALRMTLPEGWAEYPMETYRLLIDSLSKASSPEVQAFYARHLKDVDSGAVKLAAGGFIGGAVGSLITQVDLGYCSLDAAVTRLRDLGMTPTGSTLVDERSATLPIGKAVRLVETHAVPAGVPRCPVPNRPIHREGWTTGERSGSSPLVRRRRPHSRRSSTPRS